MDSLPVSAFAAFATLVCQKNSVFLCKGTKAPEFGFAEFLDGLPVSAFASENSCFRNSHEQKLQNSAQAEFWDCTPVLANETGIFFRGFGARRLVRYGFLDAKAERFGVEILMPCANALC